MSQRQLQPGDIARVTKNEFIFVEHLLTTTARNKIAGQLNKHELILVVARNPDAWVAPNINGKTTWRDELVLIMANDLRQGYVLREALARVK